MEVITEGDYESSLEYLGGIFNELAHYFIDSHFVNDENSTNINDDEDENNNEYDSRDDVDEPSPDVLKNKNIIILLYRHIVLAINSFLVQGFQIGTLFFNFAYFF